MAGEAKKACTTPGSLSGFFYGDEMTASRLFAPELYEPGEEVCFYCGDNCGTKHTKKEFVKGTFTNRDIVKYPGSDFVCGPCVESLITGYTTALIDGDVKTGRGGSPRFFSWVLESERRRAFSKRHLDFAREICLNPPEPPFSIILADSGQKQLIFRAAVNYERENYSLLLEDKEVIVNVCILKDYLEKAAKVSAAIGKVALTAPDQFVNWKNVIDLYGDEGPLLEWVKIYSTPLGELAAWLCPGKKECQDGYVVGG